MIPEVEAVRGDATKLGWPPLVARTDRDLARVQYELGHGKDVRAALLAAAASASAAGDPDTLAEIYLALSKDEAQLTSSFALGDAWVELAAGTLAHVGPRPAKQVAVARARGLVAERAGRAEDARAAYADALALARPLGPHDELGALIDLARAETDLQQLPAARDHDTRALALALAELGEHHPTVGKIEHDLGTIAYRAGDYAGSETWFDRALAIRQAAYGPDSVEVANTIEAKGNAELAMDQLGPAQEHFAQAIHLLEARLGPDNPDVANAYNDIGGAYHRAGLYEEALANAQKVLALREKTLGPDHPDVAESLVNEAIEAKNLGTWSFVDANYPRALAIYEKAYGKDSFEVGVTLINLGEARRAQGQLDAAEAAYDRARDVLGKQLGESHPILGHVWNGLGQVALARGKLDEAVPLLERAVSIRQHAKSDATDLAESRFALARAIAGKDRARAVQLATAARDVYQGAGPGYAGRLASVEAWLAACTAPERPCPAR
jgi:serine/threonine-protein kinase